MIYKVEFVNKQFAMIEADGYKFSQSDGKAFVEFYKEHDSGYRDLVALFVIDNIVGWEVVGETIK